MLLTIFTPTYNRAKTLCRIYEALCRQTDKRFEWIVVDDGSTDDTRDIICGLISRCKEFNIRYYYQEHLGKHRAQNFAIDLARGNLFITCDSNKYPDDTAVEIILKTAEKIINTSWICGIGGYRADFKGNIWGGEMSVDENGYVDCTVLENKRYNIFGDKSTAFYTEVLKKYKSPEYPGELFISESVWLLPMAMDGYKIRWIPKILIYGEYAQDGLTKNGANSRSGHVKNFEGYLHRVKVEKEARGLEAVSYMIYEAIDISKEKEIGYSELADKIDCAVGYIYYMQVCRYCHKVYGMVSKIIKNILGEELTEVVRQILNK